MIYIKALMDAVKADISERVTKRYRTETYPGTDSAFIEHLMEEERDSLNRIFERHPFLYQTGSSLWEVSDLNGLLYKVNIMDLSINIMGFDFNYCGRIDVFSDFNKGLYYHGNIDNVDYLVSLFLPDMNIDDKAALMLLIEFDN